MSSPTLFVDHVSIAVPRIDEALAFFRRVFPIEISREASPGYNPDFNWADFWLGNFKIELIEPRGHGGFVERFLEKRGPGMHHWSIDVDSGLDDLVARMEADGLRIVDRFKSDHGHQTAFISPRSAFGVLVQFWQVPGVQQEERERHATLKLRNGGAVRMMVDHLSIAVRDIDTTRAFFDRYFPTTSGMQRHTGYDGSFDLVDFYINGYRMELIQNVEGRPGFVSRFLEKRGEGLHHISIDVDELDPYLEQLEADGVRIVDRLDLGNGWKTAFISPRSAFGVLIQFWQTPGLF